MLHVFLFLIILLIKTLLMFIYHGNIETLVGISKIDSDVFVSM